MMMTEEGHRIKDEHLVEAIANEFSIPTSEAGKRIKIKGLKVSEGSKKGDNFACEMKAVSVQAEVDGEEKALEYMGKCVPMNPMREKWIAEGKICEKEATVYSFILPELKKILAQAKGKCKEILAPLCFYADNQVMIMENLKTKGFKLVDKRVGLDLDHIRLLLDQLALLHAAGYHWIKTSPGGYDQLAKDHPLFFHKEGWMKHPNEEMKMQFEGMVIKMFEGSAAIVKNYAKDRPELGSRMEKMVPNFCKLMTEAAIPKDGQFCTMLHGDCWNNNFMFLYDDDNKLISMKVLDYQLMRYGNVSNDLAYFLYTSTSPELRATHLEEFLTHYHKTLTQTLINLGYPESEYPYASFKKDFDDSFFFGYATGTFIAQVILSEKAVEAGGMMDMDSIQTEEEMLKKMETMDKIMLAEASGNVPLQERIVGLCQEAINRGVF